MGQAAKASVIVSAYNQPRELEFVFLRLLQQTCQDFEVVVADDGSTEETAELIARYRKRCPFLIVHCWHPHEGYRLPVILNKATVLAATDYLIYLNGDCLPHRRYVESHLRFCRSDAVLNGRRGVSILPSLAGALTADLVGSPSFDRVMRLLWWHLHGAAKAVERGVRIANPCIRRLVFHEHDNLIGADFSLFKAAMLAVNGFDATMADMRGSDRELGHRLKLLGLHLQNTRHLTITYHLEHPRNSSAIYAQGDLQILLSQNCLPRCRYGIQWHQDGSEVGTLLKQRLHADAARSTARSA